MALSATDPASAPETGPSEDPPSPAGAGKSTKRKARSEARTGKQPDVALLADEIDTVRKDLNAGLIRLREEIQQLSGQIERLSEKLGSARTKPASHRFTSLLPEGFKRGLKRLMRQSPIAHLQDQQIADLVRRSELFDAEAYLAQCGDIGGMDPALHYVTVGERLGLAPSEQFDPTYYGERYPDVAAAGMCLLAHYIKYGKSEGRQPRSATTTVSNPENFAPDRDTILLVSHEATRTGAPMLALAIGERLSKRYNVATILMRGGDLTESYSRISATLFALEDQDRSAVELRRIVKSILREYPIRYALVSSIESKDIIPVLGESFIPTVNLIHEFSTYTRPLRSVRESLGWTTELLFSTQMTADSFRSEHPGLKQRHVHVFPQGFCGSTTSREDADQDEIEREEALLRKAMRPEGAENALVVLGAGSVHLRKGVDLFLAAAAAAVRMAPERKLRFVWVGHGYDPVKDTSYSVYLAEQIARSDLREHFVLLNEIGDLQKAYALADLFFLSSRLDPMPNVTIEAAMYGLPVLCFAGATGVAEILKRDSVAGTAVVPHLDTQAAARRIVEFADDPELLQRVGAATRELAQKTFDMDRYVARVDEIGNDATKAMQRRRADFETILANPLFDERISTPPGSSIKTRDAAILRFLAHWSAARTAPHQLDHLDLRRPFAGFNPQIYAHHHPEVLEADVNPLADFIRKDYPKGPWLHEVIRPDLLKRAQGKRTNLRAAIHAHFHYPNLIGEFLDKMSPNVSRVDLFLSTDAEEKAEFLRRATERFSRGRLEIRVVPNRGRDIGPLLTAFSKELAHYDVIGHFHGKRSTGIDAAMGKIWREFLWQHLLGPRHPMIDIVLAQFAADERLGLVFAEEPHLCDWDANLEIAAEVAAKAGIKSPLPPFFEFPVGTMFWARPQALAPLFDLKLDWEDYPKEPLANDGTLLHALERLVPFAAENQGYSYMTAHISGIAR